MAWSRSPDELAEAGLQGGDLRLVGLGELVPLPGVLGTGMLKLGAGGGLALLRPGGLGRGGPGVGLGLRHGGVPLGPAFRAQPQDSRTTGLLSVLCVRPLSYRQELRWCQSAGS